MTRRAKSRAIAQMIACDIHLKLNRIRIGFSVPAHQHDLKNAEVVLSNCSQDRQFDVLGMRRDCSRHKEGREKRDDQQGLWMHGNESTKPSVCVKKLAIFVTCLAQGHSV